jgi:prepilin-type N-terminal cleavage/methylation domain-containing protein
MPARAATAFTIIEVLVVVSIIALLATIALPALRGARENARRTKCMAQLSQFGLAFRMHVDEHHGLLPWADEMYSLPSGWLAPLDALEPYLNCALPRLDAAGAVVTDQPFLCPSDHEVGPVQGFSYGYAPVFLFQSVYPNPWQSVSRYYDLNPTLPLLQDRGPFHGRADSGPAVGRNILRYDGSVLRSEDAPPIT